jgi:hypothetical protein
LCSYYQDTDLSVSNHQRLFFRKNLHGPLHQASTPGRRNSLNISNKRVFLDLRGGPTGNQVSFLSNTLSIIDWNQLNLDKDPAGDCTSIPCCGQFGCCDE